MKNQRLNGQLTKTMRHLCPLAAPWISLPFDQLANRTIMMLSGLATNEHRILVRGELAPREIKYPGCDCSRHPESDTSSTIMHRLTICPHFEKTDQVGKAKEIIQGKDRSVTRMEILGQLTKLAI